jgi:SEC-C motif-containing protein
MRARYVAYARNDMDYVERTTHPSSRGDFDRKSSGEWAGKSEWLGLEILAKESGGEGDEQGTVEFAATYKLSDQTIRHHELSQFKKEKGEWLFVDGKSMQKPFVKAGPKVGRNDPCPCGSGQKFKKCCGAS